MHVILEKNVYNKAHVYYRMAQMNESGLMKLLWKKK